MRDVREAFEVDETIVSALAGAELTGTTSAERQRIWAKATGRRDRYATPEYLLPRIVRSVERELPAFARKPRGTGLSRDALHARVKALAPWTVPLPLGDGVSTMGDTDLARTSENRLLFRRDLINGTVATLLATALADTSVLDIGCNCGFFSLDMAERGARRVDGIDLRPENIAQAQFLQEHFGVPNVEFAVRDADAFDTHEQWDVVLNLGVLYHMTNPFGFLRRTYELCREFAIIDSGCHPEPVAAFLVRGEKDVNRSVEGREQIELHPTYRGAIQTISAAGFSEVVEIVGTAAIPHERYATGARRCFLAMK